MACDICRVKKVKCDSTKPACQYCREHSLNCIYRQRAKRKAKTSDDGIDARLLRVEGIIRKLHGQSTEERPPTVAPADLAWSPTHFGGAFQSLTGENIGAPASARNDTDPPTNQVQTPGQMLSSGVSCAASEPDLHMPQGAPRRDMVDEILWSSGTARTFHDENSALVTGEHGHDFVGSSCGMSLLSDVGLQWVSQNAADGGVSLNNLREMIWNIQARLKLPRYPCAGSATRSPQQRFMTPPNNVARKYIDAYFASQWRWPIVRESRFRQGCEKYWNAQSSCDSAWYALYNVILALGCRAYMSAGNPQSFQESQREAWAYFENTVSVQSDLMYRKVSVQAVQVFFLMTIFAQGVGGPQPEYMYCAIAMRLATGIGLHKYSPKAWNVSDSHVEERSHLFWSLYCLEKTIAFRTGRPSMLDDSDISCPFPRKKDQYPSEYHASGEQFDFFLSVSRYARICSRIIKMLYSASSFLQTPEERSTVVKELYSELKQWRSTTATRQEVFGSARYRHETAQTTPVVLNRRVVLEYFYHDCVISLHKACYLQYALPSETKGGRNPLEIWKAPKNQLAADALESARIMCLSTQLIEIESYTPNWLIIYYPLTAIITLFTNAVMDPLAPSAKTDIALIQAVVGLFGRLEYMSSGEILLTRSGEFAKIASAVVERANHRRNGRGSSRKSSSSRLAESAERHGGAENASEAVAGHHSTDGMNYIDDATADLPFIPAHAGNATDIPDFASFLAEQMEPLNWQDLVPSTF